MGVFEHIYIYNGRLLSAATVAKLGNVVPKEFITQVADDRWALHAPGQFEPPRLLPPDVFARAKDQGWFAYRPSWPTPSAADSRKLTELVCAAADDPTAKPGTYMCESISTTHDAACPWVLTCNIPVSSG